MSRVTMGAMSAAMMWAGVACVRAALGATDADGRRAALPMILGIVLLLIAGIFALLTCLPLRTMQRIVPPRASLHENPEVPPGIHHF